MCHPFWLKPQLALKPLHLLFRSDSCAVRSLEAAFSRRIRLVGIVASIWLFGVVAAVGLSPGRAGMEPKSARWRRRSVVGVAARRARCNALGTPFFKLSHSQVCPVPPPPEPEPSTLPLFAFSRQHDSKPQQELPTFGHGVVVSPKVPESWEERAAPCCVQKTAKHLQRLWADAEEWSEEEEPGCAPFAGAGVMFAKDCSSDCLVSAARDVDGLSVAPAGSAAASNVSDRTTSVVTPMSRVVFIHSLLSSTTMQLRISPLRSTRKLKCSYQLMAIPS